MLHNIICEVGGDTQCKIVPTFMCEKKQTSKHTKALLSLVFTSPLSTTGPQCHVIGDGQGVACTVNQIQFVWLFVSVATLL